jgi:hypothetical protein
LTPEVYPEQLLPSNPELSVEKSPRYVQHVAKELDNRYTPNPFGPCGPVGPVTPCDPDLMYPDPLGPIEPLKFKAILAVGTDDCKNAAVADKLEVVTDVAKFVLPNGYDCIYYSLRVWTINRSHWSLGT